MTGSSNDSGLKEDREIKTDVNGNNGHEIKKRKISDSDSEVKIETVSNKIIKY